MADYHLLKPKALESKEHPNTRYMLWFCALYGLASAISLMGIFDAYLFVQSNNSNSTVGLAESMSGITQVLVVLPAGYLCDTFSRARILKGCAVFSLLYVVTAIYAIYNDNMTFIYASLVLGGVYCAVQNAASFALFSDSVSQGERAQWMSKVAMVTQISMGAGPLLGVVLFQVLGDDWKLPILHTILIIGFVLMIPANMCLWNWTDVKPLEESVPDCMHSAGQGVRRCFSFVPYLVCLNDLVTCIGAGMTVKFFPLFFKNDYGFSPTQLQSLFTVYCLTFALFTWMCEKVAGRIGRVQSTMVFALSGTCCLFGLAYVESLPVVILVFILRGAFQNSIYPIDRSIIMDFVPTEQRGRWNSVESISAMTWSGSAVIGGYLMDSHDYRFTFVITGWIYLCACVLRIPLLFLVPKSEKFVTERKIRLANLDSLRSPLSPGRQFPQ